MHPGTLSPIPPSTPSNLPLEFLFNGISHFAQNILAFVLLSLVSPVTYSVASLIKRVFVIVVAIVWFGSRTTSLQAAGIALTFLGLYLYDRTSASSKAEKRAKLEGLRVEQPLLPVVSGHLITNGLFSETPVSASSGNIFGHSNGYVNGGEKKADVVGLGRPEDGGRGSPWLPPGTRQEETWRPRDMGGGGGIAVW